MDLLRIFMVTVTCCYIGSVLFSVAKSGDLDLGDVLAALVLALLVGLPLVGFGLAIDGKDFFSKEGSWLVYGIMLEVIVLLLLLSGTEKRIYKHIDKHDEHIDKVNQSISEMTQRLSDMESTIRQLKQNHTKSDIDAIWGKDRKGR